MITAEDFVLELNDEEEKRNFKLGRVVALFENNTAKILFDGEEDPSEKQYAYLSSYIPTMSDRVLLAVTGGTYIILGKVNFNVSPDVEEEIDRYIFDLKTVSMLKGLAVSGGIASFGNGISVTEDATISGSLSAASLSASGNVSGGTISSTGALSGTSITGSSLSVTGNVKGQSLSISNAVTLTGLTVNGSIALAGSTRHSGTSLGFFNKIPVTRPQGNAIYSTLNYDATLAQTVEKLNTFINLLKGYGLSV